MREQAGLSKWQALMNKTLISAVLAVLMSQAGGEALAGSSKQRTGSSNTGLASYYHDRFPALLCPRSHLCPPSSLSLRHSIATIPVF